MRALRILVAEDDIVVGQLLRELLEGLGHAVCGVEATEAGAVRAALRDRPDLMVLDGELLDGTGLGAALSIQRVHAIPWIFMTGAGSKWDTRKQIVLRKPFFEADLVLAISRTIGH